MIEYVVEDRGFRTPCWILPASHSEGYGRLTVEGRRVYAHRAVYLAVKGDLPAGTEPDHLCRQRACCNPDHLQAVTRRVNARRGARTKLTAAAVLDIRAMLAGGARQREAAATHGVTRQRVSRIARREEWADVA